jgi:hypothetical protein
VFYRLRTKLAKRFFAAQISQILGTPSIDLVPANLSVLSMVSHDDLAMYLLAIKSFYLSLGKGNIVVVDDGSLTNTDKGTLARHIRGVKIIGIKSIVLGHFPRDNCWERLAYAVDSSAGEYVIQLDSDTLTRGPVTELLECIAANRAFILGTWTGQKLIPVREASAFAATKSHEHIQFLAERVLLDLGGAGDLKYVRGSAGLAGLARGGFSRGRVEDFCVRMRGLIGDRFLEWGTEQVAFNFIVANTADATVLPYPTYACLSPEIDAERARFLHFTGTYRFKEGIYAREGRRVMNSQAFSAGRVWESKT